MGGTKLALIFYEGIDSHVYTTLRIPLGTWREKGVPLPALGAAPSSPTSLLGYFSTEGGKSNSSDYRKPCRGFKVPLLSTEPGEREMLVKNQLEKSIVMEGTRIEELESDFGAVVEILYDPGWFPISLKKPNMEFPQVANTLIVYGV
ncbi:hypothetical protein DUI87_24792 [Hirundo rustica rustica]|uniref:Uncharacterized protein n=1 Tax=Hirundo rustica rustica TaxID=333673 RepID=A0A3M0JUH8_HIRRU|nr:hypothetical protein DUI87_24792 [Hirundo rustica rustica]